MFKAGLSVLWHNKCLMISLMPLSFYPQDEEEKKGCKLWTKTVSEQVYKNREHWWSSSTFVHKAITSGFTYSFHALELFSDFSVIYL